MTSLSSQVTGLVSAFRQIEQTRMQGLPFLNPALQVEAVGFVPWETGALGVLVTPWFMNLMMLPGSADWQELRVGSKVKHRFPSGCYEFTVGDEPGIGRYQGCSLFSPMQAFEDQAAAVATAAEVMHGLQDKENREGLTLNEAEVRRAWQGEPEPSAEENDKSLSERLDQPISRRALLRLGGDAEFDRPPE
ncbi:MAG: [NiFe]-hydrogenase assembly chaperone HybE [Candidatus Thiodiazotropha sp.]